MPTNSPENRLEEGQQEVPPLDNNEEQDLVRDRLVSNATRTTQTDEEDSVDSAIVVPHNNASGSRDGAEGSSNQERGFLSNFLTMVLPRRETRESQGSNTEAHKNRNSATVSTQTEEQDPMSARGQQLSYLIIQDLALNNSMPSSAKDEVFDTLCCCACDILEKHSILFNGMVNRIRVTQYQEFASIANELFEANVNNESGLRITWGRIVSLFAFATRLAQEYHTNPGQVDDVTRFLASYVTKHIIPFVREKGGWENLVQEFTTENDDVQLKRAILWSGLCVGLVATMYVSSLLR